MDYRYLLEDGSGGYLLEDGSGLLLLEGPGNPFGQSDWLIPRRLGVTQVTLSTQPPSADGVAAGTTPFTQTDWPLPFKRVFLITTVQTEPPSVDFSVMPFSQTDWPLVSKRSLALRSEVFTRLGVNVDLPPRMADWPLPRLRQSAPVWSQSQFDSRKFYYTEAVVTQPFRFDDWTVPRQQAPRLDRLTWLQSNIRIVPFYQMDWPRPLQRVQVASGLLSLSDGRRFYFDDARPLGLSDWLVPRRPARAVDLQTWVQTGLHVIPGIPFTQTDWPLPQPRRAVPGLTQVTDTRKFYFQDQFPFGPHDWPAPRPRARATALSAWAQSFIRTPGSPPVPFYQTEWPLPRRALLATWRFQHTQERKAYYQDLKPFGLSDWSMPRSKPYTVNRLTWLRTFQQPFVPPMPFNQRAWPLARVSPYSVWRFQHTADRRFYYKEPVFDGSLCYFVTVPAESRTLLATTEPRALTVRAEDRSFTTSEEPRTFTPECCDC